MGIVRGLKAIQQRETDKAARRAAAENRIDWFKLPKSGNEALVRFLQELDSDSENYSAKNDIGFIAVEHSNPNDFRRKALCTYDSEGACVGCEINKKLYETDPEYKGGWKQKERLYINVLVKDSPDAEPSVKVLSQGTSDKQITPALLEFAVESGSITNRWFKVKRKGSEFNDTSYLLTSRDKDDDVNVEDYELYDLEKAVRNVPYAEQMKHFGLLVERDERPEAEERPAQAAKSTSMDESW